MLGDTEIQPPVTPTPQSEPVAPAPTPSYTPPTYVPPRKSPLGPLLLGFFLIILIAGALAAAYYVTKFRADNAPSPSPSAAVSPSPSLAASATPSAAVKASLKPVSAIKPTPTPTPFSLPNLDLYFANPSAHIKQTVDEGTGDGRVIYREYTSIQAGQFDEVKTSWSPKVTACFHLVASEAIAGKLIKFTMTLDDKTEVEDTMSWIDRLEAGKVYDWCHDVTTAIGQHSARLTINGDKSVKESNYGNDLARVDWTNLADNVAPNFTLVGPVDEGTDGTCLFPQNISDNVSIFADLKIEQKVDGGNWSSYPGNHYCFTGTSGATHSYAIKITDARGNSSEQSKTFPLF